MRGANEKGGLWRGEDSEIGGGSRSCEEEESCEEESRGVSEGGDVPKVGAERFSLVIASLAVVE